MKFVRMTKDDRTWIPLSERDAWLLEQDGWTRHEVVLELDASGFARSLTADPADDCGGPVNG